MDIVLFGLPAGGALKFSSDGNLYLSIGDGGGAELARPDANPPLMGSILRFAPEGQIPEGISFKKSPVHASGFRNPSSHSIRIRAKCTPPTTVRCAAIGSYGLSAGVPRLAGKFRPCV
jgi:hypothetical protein